MTLERVRAGYEKLLEWIVIVLMVALAVEVTVGVVYRTLGASLVWYDEVAALLLAWLTFYGSALAAVNRSHIGCPELVAMAPPTVRYFLRLLAEVMVIGFFALVAWASYEIMDVLAADRLVSLPDVPVNWVQSALPIGAVLIIIAEIITLPAVLARARWEDGRGSDLDGVAREATH
jgi:TRAP-type transport system small permease protein